MAWSEAARRAAAEVRRIHAQQRGQFHTFGTPRYDKFNTMLSARKKMASDLRQIRQRARKGESPTFFMTSAFGNVKHAQDAIKTAANSTRNRNYYVPLNNRPKLGK